MEKPKLSWIPVRLIKAVMFDKTMTTEQWLEDAKNKFGLNAVEIHFGFLRDFEESYVEYIAKELEKHDLEVSQLTTTTDFTHPDPDERKRQHDYLKRAIVAANKLKAQAIRFVTGQGHPEVSVEKGIQWIVQGLEEIVKFAIPYNVQVRLENHWRDRSVWELPDFALKSEVFLNLYEHIKDTPVMINFDCSNALMCDENPLDILNVVKNKVVSIHASDRKIGSPQHSIIGEGDVPFDEIFRILSQSGFIGWISAEDGNPEGDEGFKKSLAYLRKKIAKYWN